MSIKRLRRPTSVGELLEYDFLEPIGCSKKRFANRIGWSLKKVEGVVSGAISVDNSIASDLSNFFGITKDFWLEAQKAMDDFNNKE